MTSRPKTTPDMDQAVNKLDAQRGIAISDAFAKAPTFAIVNALLYIGDSIRLAADRIAQPQYTPPIRRREYR